MLKQCILSVVAFTFSLSISLLSLLLWSFCFSLKIWLLTKDFAPGIWGLECGIWALCAHFVLPTAYQTLTTGFIFLLCFPPAACKWCLRAAQLNISICSRRQMKPKLQGRRCDTECQKVNHLPHLGSRNGVTDDQAAWSWGTTEKGSNDELVSMCSQACRKIGVGTGWGWRLLPTIV